MLGLLGGDEPLAHGQTGVAEHADLAVRPRLRRDPLDRVVAVLPVLLAHSTNLPSELPAPRGSAFTTA